MQLLIDGWGLALLNGLLVTLQISAGALVLGTFFGLLAAMTRLHGSGPLSTLARRYSTLFRAVPELLLILLLYYIGSMGLNALMAYIGWGSVNLSGPLVAVVVLGLVQGAYAAEIMRAAIQAIPSGVLEAGRAFGLGRMQIFRRITLPVMAPIALAGMANLWVNVLKDSALISVVGTNELLYTAKQAAGSTRQYLMFYLCAAALYYVITLVSTWLIGRLERRFHRWQPGA